MHRHIHAKSRWFKKPRWYTCAVCGAITKNPRWPFWKKVKV